MSIGVDAGGRLVSSEPGSGLVSSDVGGCGKVGLGVGPGCLVGGSSDVMLAGGSGLSGPGSAPVNTAATTDATAHSTPAPVTASALRRRRSPARAARARTSTGRVHSPAWSAAERS
ncbi:hypothetical protein [Streptomyces jumonjinensis]|uniref:Uncharacterized protein n=1 Tax=Streptomyces jumonjinensis TaxID=1945 RepID=A0A646K9Z6_STRJU|nr:hypothetical protein [Streptomyces jumonjinensis]MQS99021.1 hypothetical protein [Streptomyces jumonjinensis]